MVSSFQDPIHGCFGNKKYQNSNRFKRYDQKMKYHCSSHETGLAIGYYVVLLRYFLKKI